MKTSICLGLALLVAVPYVQTARHAFIVCDDDAYVYENPQVRQGLTNLSDRLRWVFDASGHVGSWHPVTWLSHMLDWQLCHGGPALEGDAEDELYRDHPGCHHLMSVAIHAAATVVLFLALEVMTTAIWPSVVVAALFGIHPSRVESVAWIAERKDVLSALFWMLTMLTYAWYVRRLSAFAQTRSHSATDRRRQFWAPVPRAYLLVVVFFGLGMMSKATLVTLPILLLLLDFWPLGRWHQWLETHTDRKRTSRPSHAPPSGLRAHERPSWILLEKVPLIIIAVVGGWLNIVAEKTAGAISSLQQLSLSVRVANATASYAAYVWQTVWPANLSIFYVHPAVAHKDRLFLIRFTPLATGFYLTAAWAAGLLLLVTVLVLRFRRRPHLVVGWLWYVFTLVPMIGLTQVGTHARADRFTLLPSIGLYLAIVWGVRDLLGLHKHRAIVGAAMATLVLGSLLTVTGRQVSYWKNSETLFKHAIDVDGDNYFAHNELGKEYDRRAVQKNSLAARAVEQGDQEVVQELRNQRQRLANAAAMHFEESVRIYPNWYLSTNNLGVIRARSNDVDGAENLFLQALRLNSEYANAHRNLCILYNSEERFVDAVTHGEAAIKLRRDHPPDHFCLGNAYDRLGRMREAEREFLSVLRVDPNHDNTYLRLALFYQQPHFLSQGRDRALARAASFGIEYARRQPDDPYAHCMLGEIYASQGNWVSAKAALTEALRLAPHNPIALRNLELYKIQLQQVP